MKCPLAFILLLTFTMIQCNERSDSSYISSYQSQNICYSITEEFHELNRADTITINKMPNEEFYVHLSEDISLYINGDTDTARFNQSEINCGLIGNKSNLIIKSLNKEDIVSPGWHIIYSPLFTNDSIVYQIIGFHNGRKGCRYVLLSGQVNEGEYNVLRVTIQVN